MKQTKTDSEILDLVMAALKVTVKELANKIDMKESTIYAIKSGRIGLSEKMRNKILIAYPSVNYIFMKTGQGEPIREGIEQILQSNILGGKKPLDISLLEKKIDMIEFRILESNQKLEKILELLTNKQK